MTMTIEGVNAQPLHPEPFLLNVTPALPSLSLASWITDHHDWIRSALRSYGALLFRGFGLDSPDAFGCAVRAVSPDPLGYLERAAPRIEVAEKVFTSTEFAHDQWIPFHHEMSYSHNWPTLIYFYCEIPSVQGGATPLVSERAVFRQIPEEIRQRFERHGVRYVRNYGPYLDLPWQEAFQTEDRAAVETYCRAAGMNFRWTEGDSLRTITVRQAVSRHPDTGEEVWFNHAHLFHVSNLPAEVSAILTEEFGAEGLPRNVFYGDGAPIENDVVDLIRRLYGDAAISFPWQRGDLLILDNFLVAHGREPFQGQRRILVAMSDLYVSPWVVPSRHLG
jgi:alpha-ketoglutarate-dependent taurine dioxygenase